MIVLSLAQDEAPELETDLPASVNVLLPDNEPMNLIGDSHIALYRQRADISASRRGAASAPTCRRSRRWSRRSWRCSTCRAARRVLDLYAGVGVFSAFAAPKASLVTLVESYPPAVTDADENLADFDNVDVIEGSVEEVLATLERTPTTPPSSIRRRAGWAKR